MKYEITKVLFMRNTFYCLADTVNLSMGILIGHDEELNNMVPKQRMLSKMQVLREVSVLQPQHGKGVGDRMPGMGNLA